MFQGSARYIASPALVEVVRAAVALEKPLLVQGEPGTGKTELAREVAHSRGARLIEWHVKSTTKAQQGLYEYDAVARLHDGQLGDPRVHEVRNYIRPGKLWQAFTAPERVVLLIDEIDKADLEFPNDLLLELDRMEFEVIETGEVVRAQHRPIVIITSNNEKELPSPFLRRCLFHYIEFPDMDTMSRIVQARFPEIGTLLLREALRVFFEIRETRGLRKRPSTSEALDWIGLLLMDEVSPGSLRVHPQRATPILSSALLKTEEDVRTFQKLLFAQRAER